MKVKNAPELKLTYSDSNSLKPKDIHFTIIKENSKIFTSEKLGPKNFWHFCLKT